MKWYEVGSKIIAEVMADSTLSGIYPTVRLLGSGPLTAPVLEYWLIADSETELWAPMVFQFDQWCQSMTQLATSEQRLRRMFHQDLPTAYDGLSMWAQYVDGESLASPDRDGYFARGIRFRFTPLRDLYQPSPTP